MSLYNQFLEQMTLGGMNLDYLLINSLLSFAIILLGFFVGKAVFFSIKKISKKLEVEKSVRPSFVDLFAIVIQWAIYLMFISIALDKLGIAALSNFFSDILIAIPSFVGALVLIGIGFAIAIYLRDVIEESEVTGWRMFSQIVFYFVLYVFGVYSLKMALLVLDETTTNWIIIVLTGAVAAAGIVFRSDLAKAFGGIKKS
ncbi:hypothetical protein KAR91_75550 [Candidatus Pacearchaeota archaeon]|nr:hypothetical protein [Candidatus Pacearchaeota archaeon]